MPVERLLRVVLVDDEMAAIRWLSDLLAAHPQIEIAGTATSAAAAEKLITRLAPEIVFLDIEMPGRSGLDLLARTNPLVRTVLVTAHEQHALTAFELGACDYLLKPVSAERLARTLGRLAPILGPVSSGGPFAEKSSRVVINSPQGSLLIETSEILWIEARENYSLVQRACGEAHLVRRPLGDWETELPAGRFQRISRSLLLSCGRIRQIQRFPGEESLVLFEGSETPLHLGRAATRRLRQFLRRTAG